MLRYHCKYSVSLFHVSLCFDSVPLFILVPNAFQYLYVNKYANQRNLFHSSDFEIDRSFVKKKTKKKGQQSAKLYTNSIKVD